MIEPWALALDIAAGARVHVEIFDDDDVFHLEISEEGRSSRSSPRNFMSRSAALSTTTTLALRDR